MQLIVGLSIHVVYSLLSRSDNQGQPPLIIANTEALSQDDEMIIAEENSM